MTRLGYTLTMLLGASLGLLGPAGCAGSPSDTPDPSNPGDDTPPPANTTGGDDTTFDHDNDSVSVWDLIDRLAQEGPSSFSSQMHSCTKVRYATLGRVLTSLGVNMQSAAGQLYTAGGPSLGAPNYGSRVRENEAVTTSGASREFDIFAAAAPDIIAGLPNLERCKIDGVGATLFDTNNQCQADGISCILGIPATAQHVEKCNLTVSKGSTPDIGKRVAVAAMLAAYYTCE